MTVRLLAVLLFAPLFLLPAAGQSEIVNYKDRTSFVAATRDLAVHDFEGIVPNSGFKHYQREGVLRYAGSEFRTGGGGRFGSGPVMVVGGWYQGGPAYETTSGAKLQWSPPNQPGDAFLEIILTAGATAVGVDLWAVRPANSTINVTVTTSDGGTRTEAIETLPRPGATFVGFVSDSSITSLRFTPPKGQAGVILDNLSLGKGADVRPAVPSASINKPRTETPAHDTKAAGSPADRPPLKTPTRRNDAADGQPGSGVIAYVRDSTEIRLVDPDGTNDRSFWSHPDLRAELGVFELAWKPDGSELAFSSAHESSSSPYMADIYSIRRDGSGLKRLTNAPDRAGLARFPKGSVTVNLSNFQPPDVGSPSFIVYIEGADEPQRVSIPPGDSKTVTFNSVADFGRRPQMLVAIYGKYRWFVPGVDVVPSRNVRAPLFPIMGQGYELHGAFRPIWRFDGSRISFRSGLCIVSSAPATPAPGTPAFNPLFSGKNPMGTCTWDWGPTPATADQIIYTENGSGGSNIYRMVEGGTHPGTKLTAFSDLDYQLATDLQWMPDGSGLLYSTVNTFRDSTNIFRYDFASKRTAQVTRLEKEFAREFSVSPDGRSIVFERCPDREKDQGCDLWTIGSDGTGIRLLLRNGQRPAWGR